MLLGAQLTGQLLPVVPQFMYAVVACLFSAKIGWLITNRSAGSAAQGAISTLTGMAGCGVKLLLASRGPSKEGLVSGCHGKVELISRGVEIDSKLEGFHNSLRGKAMGV